MAFSGMVAAKTWSHKPLAHCSIPDEMDTDLDQLIIRLSNSRKYRHLFAKAFADQEINTANLSRALASYQRTIISSSSRYDAWQQGYESLDTLEIAGLKIYAKSCSRCHPAPLFTDYAYYNNGLDSTYSQLHEATAYGRGRITRSDSDIGKFKTPSLRNLGFTAPYMHDGRFGSLGEVLSHYQSGIRTSSTLDSALAYGISLSHHERTALLAFLHTLDDSIFVGFKAAR